MVPTQYEVFDFHTHPFLNDSQNICSHKECFPMDAAYTREVMEHLGVSRIAGSVVIHQTKDSPVDWAFMRAQNDAALQLQQLYDGFYVPGFHVHPSFVRESCEEIERQEGLGNRLIGELVPYMHGWSDYSCDAFDQILDCAEAHRMVVSFHAMGEDEMDRMVEKHPKLVLVAAHPGEYGEFKRHMERMKKSDNYYLDLSGYGIFRHGMLRHAVDLFGAERFLYGSDYPTCNPAMYLGGVLLDELITPEQQKLILSGNARRLLGL